jgi:hypothetical protein
MFWLAPRRIADAGIKATKRKAAHSLSIFTTVLAIIAYCSELEF